MKIEQAVILAGGLGTSCNPYSVESISNGLKKMLNLREEDDTIHRRKNWASHFTYESAARKFSDLIDDVCSHNKV